MAGIEISPSILSADFTRLGNHIQEAEAAHPERFHVDVMDGRFVPNITFGPILVNAVRKCTKAIIEAHLMIVEPERYIAEFAKAGADNIQVHQETCPHLHRTIQQIHQLGKKATVVLNPSTPASTLEEILPEIDQVLVMTVNPGFGGQQFIKGTLAKIARIRQMIHDKGLNCAIEVDGGISTETAPSVVQAGATILVAGSALFSAPEGVGEASLKLRASVASLGDSLW
jgi:ribulose-phosphate 3-epimerase